MTLGANLPGLTGLIEHPIRRILHKTYMFCGLKSLGGCKTSGNCACQMRVEAVFRACVAFSSRGEHPSLSSAFLMALRASH